MTNTDLIIKKAKLKILEAESQSKVDKEDVSETGDIMLLQALEDLMDASGRIPEEEARVRTAIAELEKDKDEDKYWQIRANYLESYIETIKRTYPFYEQIARERKQRYLDLKRSGRWAAERELCKNDTLHWFKYWAWTADPRVTGFGWALPFVPYEFQEDAINWLENLIFVKRSSGLVEKSRDMGFSWLIVSLLYKHWQHGDGTFQSLIGSMTIDDVDTVGNPSSLFEKLRIQGSLQPEGLIPRGWDRQIPYLKCVNPETKASIIGESCNPRFGRSGRYKLILLDEFSAVEQDTEALTACSQSSPCKIYNSTVRGMGNEYAQLRFSGTVPVKTYHWREHPHKDERWYEFQKLDMNDDTRVAQELDIDYTASTPNRVYPDYNEIYHVITKSELMRALPEFADSKGQFRVPTGHNISMGEDVSMGDGCAHVLLWTATLKDGTVTENGTDLSGSVLVYREEVMPPKSTPRKTAQRINEVESAIEKKMIMDRLISHEAKTEREIYEDEHGLVFRHWETDYNKGISRIRDYLEIQHKDKPHPFRDGTRDRLWGDKAPQILGRPMIYLVVDDDQGELMFEPSTKRYHTRKPKDNKGLGRLRAEFPVYHYATVELGKEVNKMRPKKTFDDAMDVLRCVASEMFAPIRRMTSKEKSLIALPKELRNDNIRELSPEEQQVAWSQQQHFLKKFMEQEAQQDMSWRDRTLTRAMGK